MPLSNGLPRQSCRGREARSLAWPEIVKRHCRKETHGVHCRHKGRSRARSMDQWNRATWRGGGTPALHLSTCAYTELVLLGVNHETAPIEARERLAISPANLPEATRSLREMAGVRRAHLETVAGWLLNPHVPWPEGAGKSFASIDQTTSALFHIETSDCRSSKCRIFYPVFGTIMKPCVWAKTDLAAHQIIIKFRNHPQKGFER